MIVTSLLISGLILQLQSEEATASAKPTKTCDGQKYQLSKNDQAMIRLRIRHILDKDQQFRSYLSFGTTDEKEIQRLQKLGAREQLQAMSKGKGRLDPAVKEVLRQLQLKNDRENYDEFRALVRQHGYPSPERIGVKHDQLFVLLLHPPVPLEEVESHTQEFCELLLPEVRAGRFDAARYATFVDNMRGKILRQPQLYGTNQQFDAKTGKVLPPRIGSLEESNEARKQLGLPPLKPGEYRLVSTK